MNGSLRIEDLDEATLKELVSEVLEGASKMLSLNGEDVMEIVPVKRPDTKNEDSDNEYFSGNSLSEILDYNRAKSSDFRDRKPSGHKRYSAQTAWEILSRNPQPGFAEELEASRIRTPIPEPISFDD